VILLRWISPILFLLGWSNCESKRLKPGAEPFGGRNVDLWPFSPERLGRVLRPHFGALFSTSVDWAEFKARFLPGIFFLLFSEFLSTARERDAFLKA